MNCQVVNDEDIQKQASSATIATGLRGRGSFLLLVVLPEPASVVQNEINTATYVFSRTGIFSFLYYCKISFLVTFYFSLSALSFLLSSNRERKELEGRAGFQVFAGRHRAVQHSSFVLKLLSIALQSQVGTGQLCVSVTTIFSYTVSQKPFRVTLQLSAWIRISDHFT